MGPDPGALLGEDISLPNIGDFGEKSGTTFSTSYLWSFVTAMNP